MKGDDAIAMACAAFCIPTSISIVRLTASLNLPIRDHENQAHDIMNFPSSQGLERNGYSVMI